MEQSSNRKIIITASIMLLVGLTFGGLAAFVWKNSELQSMKSDLSSKKQQITELEKNKKPEIILNNEPNKAYKEPIIDSNKNSGLKISDKEAVEILTLREIDSKVAKKDSDIIGHTLVITDKVEGDWANTSPMKIWYYKSSNSFEIPGQGAVNIFWHKKDGQWQIAGSVGEGGYFMEAGYTESQIPENVRNAHNFRINYPGKQLP